MVKKTNHDEISYYDLRHYGYPVASRQLAEGFDEASKYLGENWMDMNFVKNSLVSDLVYPYYNSLPRNMKLNKLENENLTSKNHIITMENRRTSFETTNEQRLLLFECGKWRS